MSSSDEAPEETTFSESHIIAKRKEKLLQEARMRETQELKLKRKEKNLKFAEQKLMKEMKKLEEHTIAPPPLEEKESTDSEPMPTLKNVKVSEKIALEDSETEKTIAAQVVKQKKTKKFEDTPKAVSKVSKSSNLPPVAVSSHKSRLLSRHSLRR